MSLRYYQTDSIANIRRADSEGCRAGLIVLPCGAGKTVIAANVPEALNLQPWEVGVFLVDRDELCWQAQRKFAALNPDLIVSVEKAQHRVDPNADIIVASVQTLSRSPDRLAAVAARNIRFVICDEAHVAVSPQWIRVLQGLRVLKGDDNRDPARFLLGITATPRRHDGVGLERLFDKITYRKSIRELISEGFLCDPVAYRVSTDEDLDRVGKHAGDFAVGELERACNTPERNALVVKKYLEYGAGLPAIAFTVDVAHSEDLAATFRHHGLRFEAVSGKTPEKKRAELFDAHRRGELTGLVSCGVLSVGFDSEIATVALMARPTLSGLLYCQQVGRVLRPYPAPENAAGHTGYVKANGILIDFCANSTRHRLYTASTLFGLNPQFDVGGRSITKTVEYVEALAKQNPTLDITAYAGLADVQAAATSVDLWKPAPIPKLAKSCSQFIWMQQSEDVYRLSAPGMAVFIEVNHLGEFEVSRRMNGTPADMQLKFVEPEDAFAYADSLIPDEAVALIRASARWRKDPPKEGQCGYLWKVDPTVRKRFSSGEAFYRYADYQFQQGNQAFSKGAISQRIEMCKAAKAKAAQVST